MMMTKRIARNGARIELIACRETVEALMAQGLDKKKIHTRLTESGQFTMSYDAFCKLVIKVALNGLPLQTLSPPTSPPPPAEKPTIAPKLPSVPAAPKKLTRPEDVDRTTLF